MKKIETIWHHLLYQALTEKKFKHTQKDLAKNFGYSLSTVNHALSVPTQLGAVRKTAKFFVLADFDKLLYYWASVRNLERDIVYQTFLDEPIAQIEGLIPPRTVYAAYTAAKKILPEPPADYSKVYFYSDERTFKDVERRFPKNRTKEANVFVLKMPETMPRYGEVTTLPQTFVDIWNLHDWYAKDFIKNLEEKMHGILS